MQRLDPFYSDLPTGRGGSRGRVQGVRTPPPPEMTCRFLIQLVFCIKFVYVTSQLRHSFVVRFLLGKILDPLVKRVTTIFFPVSSVVPFCLYVSFNSNKKLFPDGTVKNTSESFRTYSKYNAILVPNLVMSTLYNIRMKFWKSRDLTSRSRINK